MTRISSNIRMWRAILLALVMVAFLGPWAFDVVNVPAQYACSPPFIRLEGDFCGLPQSGFRMILWLAGGLVSVGGRLLSGELGDARELLMVIILLLPFAPAVMTLVAILRGRERGSGWLLAAWFAGAAAALYLLAAGLASGWGPLQAWGVWLYVGLAVVMAVVEGISMGRPGAENKPQISQISTD